MPDDPSLISLAGRRRRNVALRQIELSANSSSSVDESNAALTDHRLACQQIRSMRFNPPMRLYQAILTLAVSAESESDSEFTALVLAEELHEFCQEFYSIPFAQRAVRWADLNHRASAFPQLRWRLEKIKGALKVDRPAAASATAVEELGQVLCDILVVPHVASVDAMRRLCVDAIDADNGVALGDAYVELNRTLPETMSLRTSTALPETLRRYRSEAWTRDRKLNRPRRSSLNGVSDQDDPEKAGMSGAAKILLWFSVFVLIAGMLELLSR